MPQILDKFPKLRVVCEHVRPPQSCSSVETFTVLLPRTKRDSPSARWGLPASQQITSAAGASFVESRGPNVAATITAHHLCHNRTPPPPSGAMCVLGDALHLCMRMGGH